MKPIGYWLTAPTKPSPRYMNDLLEGFGLTRIAWQVLNVIHGTDSKPREGSSSKSAVRRFMFWRGPHTTTTTTVVAPPAPGVLAACQAAVRSDTALAGPTASAVLAHPLTTTMRLARIAAHARATITGRTDFPAPARPVPLRHAHRVWRLGESSQ
ncbi:hypothetical protein [Streptomyces sp. NPDC050145]|uniref:hypothetical protein n=1 Tax=Streptomyces sp. NPDC050145 TaxID=3365602 RepID=UPI0037B5247B